MHPSVAGRWIYPLQERWLGRPTFRYLAELERTQWLSRAELEALQGHKLKALLRSARAHCPWHRRRIKGAGLDLEGEAPLSPEALQRLPTMTKQDALEYGECMVWRGVPGGTFRYNTGGSTGEPLIFYFGRWRQASDAAGRMRARRWWGVEVGDKEVYLWGAPVTLDRRDRIRTVRDRLLNQLVLNAFDMSPAAMDAYAEAIRRYRPRCVYGYASSVTLLAAHVRARGRHLRAPGLKVVCVTGEPLYEHQRSLISECFGAPVANEFGSRDIGFTAHESPEGQMLNMSESIMLEVLDRAGHPVGEGELGEAVITGLCSEAQPFIRYRTGDVVRHTAEACRAGRGLHVIGDVFGRTTDFVVRSDGAIMHALAVIYVVREIDGVHQFQIIQQAVDEVEVLIVPASAWRAEGERRLAEGLRRRLGADVRVTVRIVDAIPPEASGKHRQVVSRVPLPSALTVAQGTPERESESIATS